MMFSFLFSISFLLLTACGGGNSDDKSATLPADVNSGNFDNVWYGPCINSNAGFSARQELSISGSSLISKITSYTAGETQSHGCKLPSSGGIVIDSDVTATLDYRGNTTKSGCINGVGIDTAITLTRFQSSGNDHSTQPEMNDGVELVTGNRNEFLPNTSTVCLKSNGRLLFAGHEYSPAKPVIISSDFDWKVGAESYFVTSRKGTGCIDDGGTPLCLAQVVDEEGRGNESSNATLVLSHYDKGSGTYNIVAGLGDEGLDTNGNITRPQPKEITIVSIVLPDTISRPISGTIHVTRDGAGYHYTMSESDSPSSIVIKNIP